MSKTQQRELKTILADIATLLPSEVMNDSVRVLLFRAHTLLDEEPSTPNTPLRAGDELKC